MLDCFFEYFKHINANKQTNYAMQTDTIHTSLTFNLFKVHLKHVQNIQTNQTNPYDFYFAFDNQFKILLIGNTFRLCLKLRLLNCVSQSQVFGKEMNTID